MKLRAAALILTVLSACSTGTNPAASAARLVTVAGTDQLTAPGGVAATGDRLFVADSGGNRLRAVDSHGGSTIVGGTGTGGFGGDGGPAVAADLNAPAGLAVSPRGDVFVADRGNNRVRRIDDQGRISTVAGSGQRGFSGDGGPATAAALNSPAAVAVDPQGNLFVADSARVRRVDAGGRITTVAGGGTQPVRKGATLPATDVALGAPGGIAVDRDGRLYVAVPADNWVLVVAPDGTVTTLAGDRQGAVEDYDGPAALAALDEPSAVATDGRGSLFVTERGAARVRRIDAKGTIRTVLPHDPERLGDLAAAAVTPGGDLVLLDQAGSHLLRLAKRSTAGTVNGPARPVVTGLTPSEGGVAGKASVVIRGTGFSPLGTTATFGGQDATVLHVSPTTVLVSSPAGTAGTTVDVVVSTRAGRSATSVASRFSYEAAWEPVAPLAAPRMLHTATVLDPPGCRPTSPPYPCGTVLVSGGSTTFCITCTPLRSTELYDPAADAWRPGPDMLAARMEHTATLLRDGQVLVAGGKGTSDLRNPNPLYASNALSSAELFDPAGGTWAPTGAMTTARFAHTATPLPDGQVLVVGGASLEFGRRPLASAERYDPATRQWRPLGTLSEARGNHTATVLADGRVLVAGGLGGIEGEETPKPLPSAELYDPARGTWTRTGDMAVARYAHTATLLPGGKVLVVGGIGAKGDGVYLQSAELYDPATGTWRPAGLPEAAHAGHAAVLRPDGKVLVAGASPPFESTEARPDSLSSAELYDPATDAWSRTRRLNTGRGIGAATVLGGPACGPGASKPAWCGAVLVVGGAGTTDEPDPRESPRPLTSAEIYR